MRCAGPAQRQQPEPPAASIAVLDPQLRALIPALKSELASALGGAAPGDLERTRAAYVARCLRYAPQPATVDVCEDLSVERAGGALSVRHYRAQAPGRMPGQHLPALVFLHGGGGTCGDLESHDRVCRQLAINARSAVFSVDYRRAPEHALIDALADVRTALDWLASHAEAFSIDQKRLGLVGDEAGGYLAALAALERNTADHQPIAMQVLISPLLDVTRDAVLTDQRADLADDLAALVGAQARILRARTCDWLGSLSTTERTLRSPLHAAALSHLPPTYVLFAGHDPLAGQIHHYATRLTEAGVEVTQECFTGMVHGFMLMGGHLAGAQHAIARIGQALRPVLHRKGA